MRKASLLVLTWCFGTALAVILALQAVALVDGQITDDRGSLNSTPTALGAAADLAAEPDDGVSQIGTAETVAPETGNTPGTPGTIATVHGEIIITGAVPPPATEPTPPASSSAASATARPRTAVASSATEAATSAPPATAAPTDPPTTAAVTAPPETPPPSTAPPTAEDDGEQQEPRSEAGGRTTRSGSATSTTRPTTTRPTTTRPTPTTTPTTTPGQTGARALVSGGGTIGVSANGPVLTLEFQQPRSGYTFEIVAHSTQMIDVRFSSPDGSWRIQARATSAGQLQTKTFRE